MNFEDFLSYIVHQKRYALNTQEAYRRDLESYSSFLKTNYELSSLHEASHIMIRDYILHELESGLIVTSVKRRISTLRSYYKFLLKEGVIKLNPTSRIVAPKSEKLLPNYVKEDEMLELKDTSLYPEDFSGVRDKLMIELFYQTGMRVSELLELKDSSVNLDTKSLKVLGKRNKERIIPLSEQLINEVSVYQEARKNNFPESRNRNLVVADSGGKLDRKFVYNKVKHYLSQVSSLKKKSPHVLRHTFATHMLKNGADLNAIKEILGHSSLAATQVYAHNDLEQLKASHKKAHPRN
ncbi:MAG: tyrosine-type recombinase/integrase [Flavobacteriales bacterium]